jgi:hypothetical protein
MKIKKVNRYWCDFCGKAGLSASHMKRHEDHCTKNPNRQCGICKLLDQEPMPIPDLLAILPDPEQFRERYKDEWSDFEQINDSKLYDALALVFPKLRDLTGGCPACIMAALRQKGIPVPVAGDLFDYQKERAEIWNQVNEENLSRDGGYDYY